MSRYEPFPLTEVQEAYWVGRQARSQGGNVSAHLYMELEAGGLDLERLERAWRGVVERHDMLRAVVRPDGRQIVLPEVPAYEIEVDDLRDVSDAERDAKLRATRERLAAQVLPSDVWPLWEIRASRLPGDRARVHWSMDLLMIDGGSIALVLREWARRYADGSLELPPLETTFREYVLAVDERRRAREPELRAALREMKPPPGPELPVRGSLESVERLAFSRRTGRVGAEAWSALAQRVRRRDLTSAGFLCALFAEVLRAWSRRPAFTLNATSAFRLPTHPAIREIVGDFTTTLLLPVDGEGKTFVERAKRVQKLLLDHAARSRYAVTGVRVLKELSRREGRVGAAVMPVVFTSNLGRDGLSASDFNFLGEPVYSVSQTPHVYLDHIVMREGDGIVFHWDAVDDLFAPGVLDAMFAAYRDLLIGFGEDEARFDEERPLAPRPLGAPEPMPPGRLLHAPFVARATEDPRRVAVWTAERTFTYGEIYDLARRAAKRLSTLGAKPEDLVAVCMHKGWEQVVACLAVSMTGAAYVPVDPGLPPKRLAELFADSEASIVLTQSHLGTAFPDGVRPVIVSDDALADVEISAAEMPPCPTTPDNLAYVIYTSGSTGRPKGVMIEHRSAANTIDDINERFAVGPGDVVFALSSLSFDLSVYDLFGPLAVGAAVALPTAPHVKEPAHWAECLAGAKVTIWNSVPTLMDLLIEQTGESFEEVARGLRTIMLSGDWIPLRLANRLRTLLPDAKLWSLGGATEASIWSILFPVEDVEVEWSSVPYGRAMRGQRVYVMDAGLELRPEHVPGEIYIAGAGLSRGYLRDPEKTAHHFVTHPRTGERLYRTGDFGRYREDGVIAFLGRQDTQVKIHGHRIECGEIEAALGRHPSVAAAVVTTRGDGPEQRLAAYVVPAAGGAAGAPALREHLRERLPEHMLPSAVVVIGELPLTPNGKVDLEVLRNLPTDEGGPSPEAPDEAASEAEEGISKIVCRVLGREISRNDDMFERGADSLHAIVMLRSIEKTFGVTISMERLAKARTIAGIALEVEEAIIHDLAK